MYTVKGMMILDSNGERLVSKYYNIDGKLRAKNEQLDFERGLFAKTARNNAEIITLDGYTVVYRTVVDLIFYTMGMSHENELILLQVLSTLIESLGTLLRDRLDKKMLLEYIDYVFLAFDEIIDEGIILEIDAQNVANRLKAESDIPIAEQTVSQALQTAKDQFKKAILSK